MRKYCVSGLVFLFALTLWTGCGGSKTISGKWVCKEHFMETMVDKAAIEFKDGGKIVLLPMNIEGTYEMKADTVILKSSIFKDGLELKLKGNTLTATGGAGKVVYVKE